MAKPASSRAKISSTSAKASASSMQVPTELRCLYRGRPCGNLRSLKSKGGLHCLCAMHRRRANETQWRVDERRRQRRQQEREQQLLQLQEQQQQYQQHQQQEPRHFSLLQHLEPREVKFQSHTPDVCVNSPWGTWGAMLSDVEIDTLGQMLFVEQTVISGDSMTEIIV